MTKAAPTQLDTQAADAAKRSGVQGHHWLTALAVRQELWDANVSGSSYDTQETTEPHLNDNARFGACTEGQFQIGSGPVQQTEDAGPRVKGKQNTNNVHVKKRPPQLFSSSDTWRIGGGNNALLCGDR
ncbi:hypothetical protein TvY486_0005110 [Trypanosoma vivax Y486]|uniref:Uncharacterized protein n=1 Tax=Trypanosoma vivax (strain Y486) TaxID=1055687 RepID=F9WW08_TRYVY|nr:hypothetical protein TvY486_0005110 [Trypanosoma vivax Y486]|eukprot:CCD21775.1 hypothetical protein TvY486_0005110 [Trypanosoma vivax Y486]